MNGSVHARALPTVGWLVTVGALTVFAAACPAQASAGVDRDPIREELLRPDPPTLLEAEVAAGVRTEFPRLRPQPTPTLHHYDPASARRLLLAGSYGALYGAAAKVGSRLGLEREFKVTRLESAWLIDAFGHLYAVRHTARAFAALHRWAGDDARTARRRGAWYAGFGALLYMETINGFMPGVRFDWMDPLANGAGAWLADGGEDFAADHAWTRRLTFEVGYKSWSRVSTPDDQKGPLTRFWHDYPNTRYGLGYGLGPVERPWLRVFATYGVTSLEIEALRNQFGMGVELAPHHWIAPWLERLPLGGKLLALVDGIDRHVMLPGLYYHLFDVETGPFTGREPFDE